MGEITRCDLGGKPRVKIINVGRVRMGYKTQLDYGSTFTSSIDIKSKVPSYSKLTKDNIIFGMVQANSKWRVYHDELTDWKWEGNADMNVSYSYNPGNGVVSFTGNFGTTSGGNNCGFTADVYVIEGPVSRV